MDPVATKIAKHPAEDSPAPVKVAPVTVKSAVATSKTVVSGPGVPHVLQVASFRSPDEAGILLRRLEKKGINPIFNKLISAARGSGSGLSRTVHQPRAGKARSDQHKDEGKTRSAGAKK